MEILAIAVIALVVSLIVAGIKALFGGYRKDK